MDRGLSRFIDEWKSPDPWIKAHTSGSTGTPKEIRLLKDDMRLSARNTNAFFGITRASRLATPLSLDYIAGKMMAVRAFEAGCELGLLPISNEVRLGDVADLLAIVPSQADSVLDNCCGLARHILLGGAPLSEAMELRLACAGADAWIGYGMTETCSHVALRRVGADTPFEAMDSVWFGQTADGCLTISSDKFSWGKLVTRDVVRLIDSRRFVWLGRADNVINSGGLKIHPEQLESEIRSLLPALPPFYIVGRPDSKWGSHVCMVIEGCKADIPSGLKSILSDPRHCPKSYETAISLPRTRNGKIIRK